MQLPQLLEMAAAYQALSHHTEDHHEAIGAFLDMLTADIQKGRSVRPLPDDLAKAMARHARKPVDLDESIDGDVAL